MTALPAIAVIDAELAGYRADRYERNVRELAVRQDLAILRWVRYDGPMKWPAAPILEARDSTGAQIVIAPSLRHLRGVHAWVNEWADIYAVGRSRIYRLGSMAARKKTPRSV